MTEQYKPRQVSILDRITPLQSQAWSIEHEGAGFARDSLIRESYLNAGKALREEDMANKIKILFSRSDEQNQLIDIGLQTKCEMKPELDYILL